MSRNHLAGESSPYLLGHAGNPVDWRPWGEEAFRIARERDRPVFLSIGYSTCHWCHVMERESFVDEETARFLNDHFVSVKVDREERPDVDAVYLGAVQAMTGQGGWPLSVFLTPDQEPFFGGTYFPPEDRYGRPGFRTVLEAIADAWENRREELIANAGKMREHLASPSPGAAPAELTPEVLRAAVAGFANRFDAECGGFGPAPKFPRSHSLMFLLRQHERNGEPGPLEMVESTLDAMDLGGIHDHLGGGLCRYATDRRWLVPHFEKMLYDQALVARAALEAYSATGEERFARFARDVLGYVRRDLADPGGGFHTAEDADSEGEEGKFYLWEIDELLTVLGEEDGRYFAGLYGATAEGNYRDEATGRATGKNILHLPRPLSPAEEARAAPLRERLFAAREQRVRPAKDDKVLTDGNGLAIGALALAGRVLDDPGATAAAVRAAGFVLENLTRDGRLFHRYRAGAVAIPGFLDDHAFLADGLCELYRTTFDLRWLEEALRLVREAIRLFADAGDGGFWLTADDAEPLVARTKEVYDGAVPSGNSVLALACLRLGRLTGDEDLVRTGERILARFSGELTGAPLAFPYLLMALDFAVGPVREVVLAGAPGEPGLPAMVRELDRRFLPRTVVLRNPGGEEGRRLAALAPFAAAMGPVDGRAAAWVCTDRVCHRPVTDAQALGAKLDGDPTAT